MEGTIMKSTEIKSFTWFSRNVRQVCEGGFWGFAIYLCTVDSETSIPILRSSPWTRGAPQSGFSSLIYLIILISYGSILFLRILLYLLFQRQYSLNPFRCHLITVLGLTITNMSFQSFRNLESKTQIALSWLCNFSFWHFFDRPKAGAGWRGFLLPAVALRVWIFWVFRGIIWLIVSWYYIVKDQRNIASIQRRYRTD